MAVCHFGYGIQVSHVRIGVAEGFNINHLRVGPDSSLQCLQVVDIHYRVRYTLRSQCMRYQVERAAIQVISSHDVVTDTQYILQGIGDGSCTRSHSQTGHTPFKSSHTLFEDPLRRVRQPSVDVAGIA